MPAKLKEDCCRKAVFGRRLRKRWGEILQVRKRQVWLHRQAWIACAASGAARVSGEGGGLTDKAHIDRTWAKINATGKAHASAEQFYAVLFGAQF